MQGRCPWFCLKTKPSPPGFNSDFGQNQAYGLQGAKAPDNPWIQSFNLIICL